MKVFVFWNSSSGLPSDIIALTDQGQVVTGIYSNNDVNSEDENTKLKLSKIRTFCEENVKDFTELVVLDKSLMSSNQELMNAIDLAKKNPDNYDEFKEYDDKIEAEELIVMNEEKSE